MDNTLPKEYYTKLEEIQAADFVVLELTLYLDTHPTDAQAIAQFNQFTRHSMQLKKAFETQFGPLQQGSINPSKTNWAWSEFPWPWQV